MKRLQGLISVGALALMTGSAMAQIENFDPTPYNFSFRFGIVMPGTDPLREIENNWLSIGIDYTFSKQYVKGSETYLSIDWIGKSGSGEKGSYWPILVNQKFFTAGQEDARTYITVGVGVVNFNVSSSDTVFGGRLGFGVELSRQIFAEASYFASDAAKGGLRAQSFGAYIGYRF
ncbi:MAG: hypothetical protein HZC36_00560 [Armatimonadetes bacterium]|nr:hypothetical protein [Armatimonadota bacterium]